MALNLGLDPNDPRYQQLMAQLMRTGQINPMTTQSQVDEILSQPPSPEVMAGMEAPTTAGTETPEQQRARLQAAASADLTGTASNIEAQRNIAQSLRGQAMPQGREVGPYGVYMGPNWGETLGYAGSQVIGGLLEGRARDEAQSLERALADREQAERGLERLDVEEQRALEATLLEEERAREDQTARTAGTFRGPDGDVVRGYTQYGAAFAEDGTPLPEGYVAYTMPKATSASRWHVTTTDDAYGNKVITRVDKWGELPSRVEFADGSEYEPGRAEEYAGITTETEAGRAQEVSYASETGKYNVRQLEAIEQSIPQLRSQLELYNDAIEAVAGGANTGPVASRIISFKQATVALEAAQDALAMDKISQHTFGALSEAEAAWLRNVAIPTQMRPEYLGPFLERKRNAMQKLLLAHEYEARYRRNNKGEPPPQEHLQMIMYGQNGEFRRLYGNDPSWMKGGPDEEDDDRNLP